MTTIKQINDWFKNHREEFLNQESGEESNRDLIDKLIALLEVEFTDLAPDILEEIQNDLYDWEHNGNLIWNPEEDKEFDWEIIDNGGWQAYLEGSWY